ncbi:GntR family transcriptional regulator [Nonomuraea longispora]|uniref:GntR family transcriptional regulator n=1 Tax=Nonomuraea longispora TaxID=1848320 RepID=A0A4R4NJK7_9ACTN|nr:GntR family transcriptional regulator [Nonomuraea longispora]TDC07667.1 GntR family transcriptional regulator [Nonomuraea longispora]
MIDFGSDRPVHRQLADIIRADIAAGRLKPGQALPSETRLMQEYELGRVAVRQALGVLRSEGLVVTVKREGSYVRPQVPVERVAVEHAAEVTARMPSPEERRELDIPEGVPVFVIKPPRGRVRLLPADRTILVWDTTP